MGKITAAILSLLVAGLGQFYAGQFWRACAWFFGAIILGTILVVITGGVGIILLPLVPIASAIDAYRICEK